MEINFQTGFINLWTINDARLQSSLLNGLMSAHYFIVLF